MPSALTADQPSTLQLSFQNMTASAVTATVDIAIFNLDGGQIGNVPESVQIVDGLMTTNLTAQWTPSADIPNGSYYASAFVTVDGTTIGPAVAYFTFGTCAITTSAAPPTGGTTSGDETVNYGSNVTVTATENPGYRFVSWSAGGTVVGTNNPDTFPATTNLDLLANFSQIHTAIMTKLQVNLNFAKSLADTINLSTKLDLPGITNISQLTSVPLIVAVGTVQVPFTLNKKGRATRPNDTCQLTYTKPSQPGLGSWTAAISLLKGAWSAPLAQYGLTNATITKAQGQMVTLPVSVLISNVAFTANQSLHYTATLNRAGTAKE